MKRIPIILANILIVFIILCFVSFYVHNDVITTRDNNTENFINMTVGMEQVTTNYLVSEQRTCDNWASYINHNFMTMEEARDYLETVQTIMTNSAHVVTYKNGKFEGLSNRSRTDNPEEYHVVYDGIDIFSEHILAKDNSLVNATRSFTNPMNGIQSIAFCNNVTLKAKDGSPYDAVLMRVIPVDSLSDKWVFPTDKYKNAQISMIDIDGNYIIRGKSFKNSNFFEFYKSYNNVSYEYEKNIEASINNLGQLKMFNSKGEECLIIHLPVNSAPDWFLISYIPMTEITRDEHDWLLLGVVAISLIMLVILDLIIFMIYNKKLAAAADSARHANKAKTDFLSTMSHDIRTPMNAITGLTMIAEKNIDDKTAVQDNLKKIRMASNHLLTLINDILDISKVESGRVTLSPLTFSIVDTAENLVNISQPMVREKNIDFRFRSRNFTYEFLYADQLRINQIFINILSNALKYTPEGKLVAVDLIEEPSEKKGYIKLIYSVADTGMGISEEFMKNIYTPFTRETDSRINAIQGTGLGLAITKKMVDLMEGTIECQSEVGKGTTFTVTLELQISDIKDDDYKLPPMDVLVVDDDEVLLDTAQDTLRELGVTPYIAQTGEKAIELVTQMKNNGKNYNIIILDWKMPGLSGLKITKRIRELVGEKIPILLVSSYDWVQIEDEAKNAGINGFISKPLFRSSLYKKISEVLGINQDNQPQDDTTYELSDMHVLIAEDMDVNWEIIKTLLEMYGIKSDRAENGKIAVDMLRNIHPTQYDAVFMDIQMPVMNGLDATREIRKLENPYAAGIPIIAMTADAFSENVMECMEAGMNGHISKPIDIKLVIRELKKIQNSKIEYFNSSK